MAGEEWKNCGREIYQKELEIEGLEPGSAMSANISGAIKRASLQWYKMKWQFTSSANDLWGEEVQGYADVSEDNPLGHLPTFSPGRIHEIRARFFNLTRGDDAANDFRCAFLKMADSEQEGPFDISFTTGSVSCFDNVASLQEFLSALNGDDDSVRDWAMTKPENYCSLVEGLRRFPACWSCLDYHCHATYSVPMENGSRRMVRFRLHGSDDSKAKLSPDEQKQAWIIGRPDIELPSDTYLHDNMHSIATKNCFMKLQVQIRDEEPGNQEYQRLTVAWDDDEFPWRDVADVSLTHCVPKKASERAKYNFNNIPDDIRIATPEKGDNFAGLMQIREKVLTNTVRKKHPESDGETDKHKTTFLIHVETGTYLFSGTDAGVYIALYGTSGRTDKLLLDKLFHDDFERGSKEAYYVEAPDIGDVMYVKMFLIGGKYTLARNWYLRNVVIFDVGSRKMVEVPCYRWVTDKVALAIGNATLPQDVKDLNLSHIRRLNLQERQKEISWGHDPGMPGRIGCNTYAEVPLDLKFATERQWQKKYILTDTMVRLKLHNVTTGASFESFEDFEAMAKLLPVTETAGAIRTGENWKKDVEFGRQFLYGMNPMMIRKCSEPLPNFPVTDSMLDGLLDRGLTLIEEMKAGHVYYIDYKDLENIPRKDKDGVKRYLTNPLVLFYVKSTDEFVPLAIQLDQTPGADNPIWTPNDAELDWLFVKMWVKTSDSHYHSIVTHLFRSHLYAESVSVAIMRQLPPSHPVFKLLIPHTRYVIASAVVGREVLLTGEDSVLQKLLSIPGHEAELMTRVYKRFHYDDLFVPKELANRGVDNETTLPNYFYRDDAMRLWRVLHGFVQSVVGEYYKDDNSVRKDSEVQNFIKSVHDKGLRSISGSDNGVPSSLSSVVELADFCTAFIFCSSCFHAAANYGQLDHYIFGPNYPGAMRRAPPTKKGETTLEDIIETLPGKSDQALAIAFAFYLTESLNDEVYFGEYPDAHFTEVPVRKHMEEFRMELKRLSNEIKERNKMVDVSYLYLLPENIPNSAAQ